MCLGKLHLSNATSCISALFCLLVVHRNLHIFLLLPWNSVPEKQSWLSSSSWSSESTISHQLFSELNILFNSCNRNTHTHTYTQCFHYIKYKVSMFSILPMYDHCLKATRSSNTASESRPFIHENQLFPAFPGPDLLFPLLFQFLSSLLSHSQQ